MLRGELPGGIQVGNAGQAHRPGTDLTFSLPKSWSLLALVGGDQRIIDAYREAVIETLRWAEKNAAQTRMGSQAGYGKVATDNLTIGLFQHDTNRNQEPNLHFHAVVANVTQGSDGKWRALRNDKLWSFNTLLNSMTMARFRLAVEKMGYEAGPVGKHGNFEAAGIAREQVMAFSTRREEVLAAVRQLGENTPKTRDIAVLDTRKSKAPVRDWGGLLDAWRQRAREVGIDLSGLIDASQMRAATKDIPSSKEGSLLQRGIAKLREFAQRIKGDPADPLIPAHVLKQDAPTIAAAQAVASAVRHLSQREAAFPREGLLKAALDFGLPTTVDHVETRVHALVRSGALESGKGEHKGWLASREALDLESTILANVDQGRGAALPILDRPDAAERVQAVAALNHGISLNEGQEAVQRGLKANGELGPRSGRLTVHSRVNVTYEELRYLRTYQPGMVLNFRSRDSTQKLSKGDYTVKTIDQTRRQLVLEDRKGRLRKFNPARLRPGADDSRLSLFERKSLSIIEGDKIRWTDNDHKRGLFNADQARIVAIDTKGVMVETSAGKELRLSRGDPMLKRMDLAYALNAHMAQGLTSDRGIAVMDSRERNLANRQTFLVTVTRLRDGLTLIADNAEKLGRAIKSNSGEKASALVVTQRLKAAAAKGLSQDKDVGSASPASDKPELTKERVKPFEIGI